MNPSREIYIKPEMEVIEFRMIRTSEIETIKTLGGDFIIESKDGDTGYGPVVS